MQTRPAASPPEQIWRIISASKSGANPCDRRSRRFHRTVGPPRRARWPPPRCPNHRREPELTLGRVHQPDLSRLVEIDGRPAKIADGDILVLRAGRVLAKASSLPTLFPNIVLEELRSQSGIDLHIQLPATPVVEPPPSTYAAMLHRDKGVAKANRLSLPLYALSPLPRRIALFDALAGFGPG